MPEPSLHALDKQAITKLYPETKTTHFNLTVGKEVVMPRGNT